MKITVFWDVTSQSDRKVYVLPPSSGPQTTAHHVLGASTLHIHCHENIKSHKLILIHMKDDNLADVNNILQMKQSTGYKVDRTGSCMK